MAKQQWYHGLELREPPVRSTAQGLLKACPRKFLFKERLGLHRAGFSEALFVGDLFHRFLAAGYRQQSLDGVETACVEEAVTGASALLDPDLQMLPSGETLSQFRDQVLRSAALSKAMAEVFFSFHPVARTLEVYEVEGVEVPVQLAGVGPAATIQVDLLLKNRTTGEYWIVDHKTTGGSPTARAAVLAYEFQPRLYKWVFSASRNHQVTIGGTCHNIMRKPTISFCKKDASYAAYVARVRQWYLDQAEANPEDPPAIQSFVRHTGPLESTEFKRQFMEVVRASRGRPTLSRYPRVAQACFQYGRPCPYLCLCRSEAHLNEWPATIQQRFVQQFRELPTEGDENV